MQQLFTTLGLSAKETQTFLKLLELGAQPVSVIAKHVGVPRTTMYFILERLRAAQLVEEFERSGMKYVKCIPVESIGDVLRLQERKARNSLEVFEQHLPELKRMESTLSITPKVKFAEGPDAVMAMYESVLQEKTCSTIFHPGLVLRHLPQYLTIVPVMVRDRGATARELLVECPEAQTYKASFASEKHGIRILPSDTLVESDCFILPDRVCMIAYGDDQISGLEIFGKTLAKTQQALFDRLWASVAD